MIPSLLLILFYLFLQTEQKYCPSWECATTQQDGKCWFLSKESNETYQVIQAGPFCSESKGCFLSEYSKGKKDYECEEVEEKDLNQTYYSQALFEKDELQCDKYCKKCTESANCKGFKCDTWSFVNDKVSSSDHKSSFYKKCERNSNCIKSCDCVFTQDHDPRCSISANDTLYQDYFEYVCSTNDDLEEDKTACALYILSEFYHYIYSLKENSEKLPCLENFFDYYDLMNLKEKTEDKIKEVGIIIGVILGVFFFLVWPFILVLPNLFTSRDFSWVYKYYRCIFLLTVLEILRS